MTKLLVILKINISEFECNFYETKLREIKAGEITKWQIITEIVKINKHKSVSKISYSARKKCALGKLKWTKSVNVAPILLLLGITLTTLKIYNNLKNKCIDMTYLW